MGLVTGLGAATADAAYGCVAACGLSLLSNFLIGQRVWLGILGGLFLIYLGIRSFVSAPTASPGEPATTIQASGLLFAYFSTLLLTIANPMTILSFVAVFAGLGLGGSKDYLSAMTLVAGVFCGSALWWLLLSSGIAVLKQQINSVLMRWVNRLSGVIILAFGLYSLWRASSH